MIFINYTMDVAMLTEENIKNLKEIKTNLSDKRASKPFFSNYNHLILS